MWAWLDREEEALSIARDVLKREPLVEREEGFRRPARETSVRFHAQGNETLAALEKELPAVSPPARS